MKSHRGDGNDGSRAAGVTQSATTPGKRTLTESLDAATDSGAGQSLPGPLQLKFGRALGADLSGVRVHSGAPSAAAADSMGAQAYTSGQDIHFAGGKYDPSSQAGEHLLAHEVVHTVQQRGSDTAAPQTKLAIGEPGGAAEREADTLATVAVEGGTGSVTERPPAGGRVIQRNPAPGGDAGAGADATVVNPGAAAGGATGTTGGGTGAGAPAAPVVRAGIDLTSIGQDKGIRVAVGFYSSPTDIAANATKYQAQKLKDALARGDVKPAGDQALIKKVVAQIAAGTSDPEANTTPADATMIANAVAGNNAEFGYRATIHASQRKTIGGTAGALAVGKHMPFDEATGRPIEAIKAVSTAIGSLATPAATPGTPGTTGTATPGTTGTPGTGDAGASSTGTPAAPAAAAAPANIAEVAFFTHGVSANIGLSLDGWMNGGSVASALGPFTTPSVQVLVYGCSAAGGKDSFAETLATALAKAGHKARVFGHTSAGPATVNADGREFTAESDGAGGAKVTSATDYEMVFTLDFQNAEMAPIATDLGIDLTKGAPREGWTANQYAVADMIAKASKSWLGSGLSKFVKGGGLAGANEDGTASTEEAAYTLGVARDPTVAALRKAWQAYRITAAGKADLLKRVPAKSIAK